MIDLKILAEVLFHYSIDATYLSPSKMSINGHTIRIRMQNASCEGHKFKFKDVSSFLDGLYNLDLIENVSKQAIIEKYIFKIRLKKYDI